MTRLSRRSVVRGRGHRAATLPDGAPLVGSEGPESREVEAMIQWREGRVAGVRGRRRGVVELDSSHAVPASPAGRAARWPIPTLVGEPGPGERVLLNTTALEAGLGTGGYALVVARAGPAAARTRRPARPPGQGPLHTAAGHGARRRTSRARRTTTLLRDADDLRRHAGRRRRPALGAAGRPGRRCARAARAPGWPT